MLRNLDKAEHFLLVLKSKGRYQDIIDKGLQYIKELRKHIPSKIDKQKTRVRPKVKRKKRN